MPRGKGEERRTEEGVKGEKEKEKYVQKEEQSGFQKSREQKGPCIPRKKTDNPFRPSSTQRPWRVSASAH